VDSNLGTVLVVDDEEVWLGMLSQFLQGKGFNVLSATNGPSALALLAQDQIDLVLLDFLMPEMDGLEVLDKIRHDYSRAALPVIMATAKTSSRDIVTALRKGANDYLTKPFDFPVVLARVETQMSLKRSVDEISKLQRSLESQNQDLENVNAKLTDANRKMKHDLEAAAKVQEAMLPSPPVKVPGVHFEWCFRPCDELAGDHLNILPVDESQVSFFVLDVVGHGVQAALLAVTVNRVLAEMMQTHGDVHSSKADSSSPRHIADRLSRLFTMEELGKFFTIAFCNLDLGTRECMYTCAGHPGPIYCPKNSEPVVATFPGFPIGTMDSAYEERGIALHPGDRLFLYSDGVVEAQGYSEEPFGVDRMLEVLRVTRDAPLHSTVEALALRLESWHGDRKQLDDISILALEISESR